jgi:hypothetical protein
LPQSWAVLPRQIKLQCDYVVKKFTLLNSVAGALNASRTFNSLGDVTALVGFTDKTQAIIRVGIP